MKIKEITLHGFKSFPDRVTLSFPPGIIAIVGPNGCGKSNLVDAIRWVLGEQSLRLLRGKRMEDVIFKGSASRKAMGMAEVSMTLTASDGHLPAPFQNLSEISIARRLYRSGESEYLINRRPCRLKDITDLFLDRGVASRIYSIVEQAQMDLVLEGRGEGRRILIEETAGTFKYRDRKREALQKIESAQQNLLRVEEVMKELKRQMASLMRQAKAAERHKLIKEEIKALELAAARREFLQLKDGLDRGKEGLQGLKEEENLLTSQMRWMEEELKEQRDRAQEQERLIQQMEDRALKIRRHLEGQEADRKALTAEREIIERQRKRVLEETKEGEERLRGLMEEIEGLKQEIESLGEAKRGAEVQINQLEGKLSETNNALTQQRGLLEEARFNLFEIHREASEQSSLLSRLGAEIEKLTARKKNLEKGMAEAEERLARMEEEQAEVAEQLNRLKERMETLQKEREEKGAKLTELKSTLDRKQGELSKIRDDVARLHKELEADQGQVLTQEGHPGIQGTLADIITVEHRYEKAVEAVLHNRLRYLIVDDLSTAAELIPEAGGRVGFIPRNIKEAEAEESVKEFDGLIAPLSRLVTAPPQFATVIRTLLRGWLLVRDLGCALKALKSCPAKFKFVTEKGELVYPDGVMVSAPSKGEMLAKRREIAELRQALASKERQVRPLNKEVERLLRDALEMEERVKEIEGALARGDEERAGVRLQMELISRELPRVRGNLQLLRSEASQVEEELNELLKAHQETLQIKGRLDGERRNKEEELRGLKSRVAELEGVAEGLSESLGRTKVEAASIEERHRGALLRLKRLQEAVEEVRYHISRRSAETQEFDSRLKEIDLRVQEINLRGRESLEEAEEVKREIEPLHQAHRQALEEIRRLEGALQELRERHSTLSVRIRDKEVEVAQINLSLDHLVNRMRESYSVDIDDAASPHCETESPQKLRELKEELSRMGEVNPLALEEYNNIEERLQFLSSQHEDLTRSIASLNRAIGEMDRVCREKFLETFHKVDESFNQTFRRLFQGGRAHLTLRGEDPLGAEVDISVEPPGKRLDSLPLLSGGEKTLTALAFILALFSVKASPFCFLDEVDAALDDANIVRFISLIKEMSANSQLILITHNKRTMEVADTLYGITMEESGVSKMVSVKLS